MTDSMADIDTFSENFPIDRIRKAPLIPLRDTVIFPHVAAPLIIRRDTSLTGVREVVKKHRLVVCVAQRTAESDSIDRDAIYTVGTLARIREETEQKKDAIRVVVEGICRVQIADLHNISGRIDAIFTQLPAPDIKKNAKIEALMFTLLSQFRRAMSMGANVPFDIMLMMMNITDPWLLTEVMAAHNEFQTEEKQLILEAENIEDKLELTSRALGRQLKLLEMASKIQADTGKELDKLQREIFLREQLKSVERELETLGVRSEPDELQDRVRALDLPDTVREKIYKEADRLKMMPAYSPEAGYIRTYLETICDLPWARSDESKIDIVKAKRILNNDHYGLQKVKERILEFLAVQKLAGRSRGSILCFVGPPGVGKTSLGKSIARSLGRKFSRVSLGGVRDEAEIRGHRRTYVGAMPGRIMKALVDAKSKNPVIMLDEIDKVGSDFRGDPSAALLEALDPEQNAAFSDHYIDVPFDLSHAMFITTANVLDTIPSALRDRMEVIEFPGYTEEEKAHIAKDYLWPKAVKDHGLFAHPNVLTDRAIEKIIRSYTREAGVRNVERNLNAICRKIARLHVEGKKKPTKIDSANLERLLGPEKYQPLMAESKDAVGVVTGLAWTEAGGEILHIEATKMPGKGTLILTGHLGQVMQESAQAAFSYARSRADLLDTKDAFYKESDIHVHVPSGAIPKDGPSAGVAMSVALISLLTGRPARRLVAMTGEITLRGRILPIGGVKEKVLAAHRAGITTIILPYENKKDLIDIPASVRSQIDFVFARTMDDVLKVAIVQGTRAH